MQKVPGRGHIEKALSTRLGLLIPWMFLKREGILLSTKLSLNIPVGKFTVKYFLEIEKISFGPLGSSSKVYVRGGRRHRGDLV